MKQTPWSNLLLEQSKDPIWMVNADLQLVYANKSYQRIMVEVGGAEKKLNESVLVKGFGEGYIEKWKAYYTRALKGESFEIEEHYYNPKADEIRFGQTTFEPLTGNDQKVFAVACQSRDITRIVKQRSEVNQLMDASLDVFCTVNEQGNFVYVSAASVNHWGYTPAELIGRPFWDLILEEDVPKTSEIIAAISSGQEINSFANRYRKKNGDIAYNLWSARWDDSTKLRYAVARDGKDKIEQEEKIRQSEQRFKALVQEGSDLIGILDVEGNYKYVSPTSTAVLGIAPEEFIGRNAFEFIHPDDAEKTLASLQKITTENRVVVEPFRFQNHKREWRWIETVLTNMLYNPAVNGIVANSRDITDRVEEEHKLKLLESVITNTRDAILITEAEPFDEPGNRIIYVNEAFTEMTGYQAEEVIGKSPRMLQGLNSDKEELAKFGRSIRNWQPSELTTINYKKNGEEFWVNFKVTPVANEKGWYTHWISIERDVTEQKTKELENELLAQISVNFSVENDFVHATNELCKSISKVGKFDWVELWTSNLEKNQMQLFGHYVADPADEIFYKNTAEFRAFKIDESMPGKVWAERKELLWNEIESHKDFVRREAAKKIGLKSVLGIPLIFNNEVVGVLNIGTKYNANQLKNYTQIFKRLEGFIGSELNRKKLENDLSHLFDSIPDILCLMDVKGRFLKINKAGCALLGYGEEEILNYNFDKFIHSADKDIFTNELLRLGQGETTFKLENRYVTKKGDTVWLSWYCNSAMEEELIYATAKNITEEKKLRELNRQAGSLAKIGSWEVDLIKQRIFWSDEVHQMHETDPNSFVPNLEVGINFYREDFRQLVQLSIEKSISTGEPFDFEAVLVTAKKKELWVRAIGNAEFVGGVCTRIYGSFQDINSLKESENRLISLSENLPGIVYQYIVQPDGTDYLSYVSGAVEHVWGFTANEVIENINLVWNQINAGGELEQAKASILKSIQTKSKWSGRFKYVLPTGELRIHLGNGTPIFLADGTIVFNSIILDITKEVITDELLTQASAMARIGSWEMDLINQNGGSMYWSPLIKEILEVDDSYDTNLTGGLEFYTGESNERIKKVMAALINQGIEFDEELLLLSAKGNKRWIRALGKSDRVNNKCIKIYGSFQDIDERKKAEIKLVESENRLRTILEAEPECIKLLDANGDLLMMNHAGLAMIEADSQEQVLHKSMVEILLPEHRAAFSNLTKNIFKGESGNLVFEIKGLKGTHRWLETHAVPLKNEQGEIISLLGVTRDITESRKAEVAIKDSEEKRRLIMNAALDAIICIDKKGNVTFWNPQAERIFGWMQREVMGKKLSDYIIPENLRSMHDNGMNHYLKTGEAKVFNTILELSAVNKNGKIFPIELTVIPIKQGKEEFFCAFIRDITQRKKIDQEKNSLQTTLENSLNEIYICDTESLKFSYVNKGALLNLGYSEQEVKTLTPLDIKPDYSATSYRQLLAPLVNNEKEKIIFFARHKRKDGSLYPVEVHLQLVTESNSKKFLAIILDITERKKAEESILQSNERFEKVTEATKDAIWDWDIVKQTYYRSKAIERFFGKKAAGLFAKSDLWIGDHFHPEDLANVKQSFYEAIADPLCNRWESEYRVIDELGELLYVIDRAVIIRNKEGQAIRVVGAMTDISEQKSMTVQLEVLNKTLQQYTEELERSNEELEQFAFVASHDLQEPLRMISSFMDLLQRKYGEQLDEKGHQYIHFATDGAKRMKQIILDLLEYSRANRPTEGKEEVDMNEVLTEFKQLRRKIISEKNATIKSSNLPKLTTYKAAITQILHCLLDNALKYTEADTPPIVSIGAVENEKQWEFSIQDNGIGIDPQFHEKIFVIFQRLHNKDKYAGTGIGLSIAKRHVEFLGGRIWLKSALGEGTIFYFTIPKNK